MTLTRRLLLSYVLVALFAAAVTGFLAYWAATGHFEQFLAAEGNVVTHDAHVLETRHAALPADLRASSVRAGVVALGVGALVGSVLAARLTRPVRNLTAATSRYGRGERGVRVEERGDDELTELARSFNHLADQLALEEARERHLFADVAHELRTPLTVLRVELEALQDGLLDATPDTHGRLVEEVDLLTHLVEDLSFLSLSDAGELRFSRRPLDLSQLARSVVSAFEARVAVADVTIARDLMPALVEADPERARQLLYNLMDNAVRHTPRGGEVRVILKQKGDRVDLLVLDTGPGIPTEHLSKVFERFYRVDAARSPKEGGSGLGLSIVRAIAQAHGGSVSAVNRAEGGACFHVTWPALAHTAGKLNQSGHS